MSFTRKKKTVVSVLIHVFFIVFLFLYNLPTISMVGTALKGKQEAMSSTALIPLRPNFSAFSAVLRTNFIGNVLNSIIVSVTVCVFCIFLACLAGYAISRFRGKVF